MPKPLAPTGAVAHLQDQAERYDSNVSVTDSRAPSEGRFPYSNRTPAHSVSSIGRSSTRRKPPPGMPQPMISVQPPTRNNSYQHQPADAPSIIYSPPAQRRTPQPHPVSPIGPPTVSIISPVPQRPRSTSGPSITITAPEMRSAPSPRPLRRQASASSIGSATSSVHSKASKRSAYKRFDKHDYVDPAFMATNNPDQNPFTPGTPAAAMFNDLSRPPSPTGSHAARW
ncbi:hypothetical protein EXIGLDRAFT_356199 [Exidia glandulosa HHB12029]|uniref:Uncharacterized protein n=1 Tax=Exidia glandulosa HHB12029 TaxID=1314781 RepID=A0A165C9V3_EXIGL|nr:hypothetical protein EXIGLDRAFT_356199 [Exidia glandulosa HHB12029]